MKLSKRRSALVAAAVAAAMLLSACGGSDDNAAAAPRRERWHASASTSASPRTRSSPATPPRSEGSQVIYVAVDRPGPVRRRTARSSTPASPTRSSPTTATNWTVKLKDGWTFHDGTPVTAAVLRRRLELHRLQPQRAGRLVLLREHRGLRRPAGRDRRRRQRAGEPAAKEMCGLKVVDDPTFTVHADRAVRAVPGDRSATPPFYPLPEAFFDDPEAFGKKPIGNGPFKADERLRPRPGHHACTPYDDYAGDEQPRPTRSSSASTPTSTPPTPTRRTATSTSSTTSRRTPSPPRQDEFGDRYIETPSSSFTYIGFPTYDERYADPSGSARPSRMAIDRRGDHRRDLQRHAHAGRLVRLRRWSTATARTPASTASSTSTRPTQLLDEAGFDRSKPIELWFNAGAGHDAWIEAVGNQLRENLGVDYVCTATSPRRVPAARVDAKGCTGPFRMGWSMDYPSPQNYLEPLYSTQAQPPAGSNYAFYSNPRVRRAGRPGQRRRPATTRPSASTTRPRTSSLEDMPIIPMFFGRSRPSGPTKSQRPDRHLRPGRRRLR